MKLICFLLFFFIFLLPPPDTSNQPPPHSIPAQPRRCQYWQRPNDYAIQCHPTDIAGGERELRISNNTPHFPRPQYVDGKYLRSRNCLRVSAYTHAHYADSPILSAVDSYPPRSQCLCLVHHTFFWRALLDHRRARFAQRPYAGPGPGGDSGESALTSRLKEAARVERRGVG